jgi:hypothetical protein
MNNEPAVGPQDDAGHGLDDLQDQFAATGAELLRAVIDALPGWITACLARFGIVVDQQSLATAEAQARSLIEAPLANLLSARVDAQRSTPLAIIRTAVAVPTALLALAGLQPVARDPFDERAFPDDLYAIAPATWSDLGEEVGDAGLRWSVNKAFLHSKLHRNPHP